MAKNKTPRTGATPSAGHGGKKSRTEQAPRPGRGSRTPRTTADTKQEPPDRVLFSFQYADTRDHDEWRWPTGDEASEMLGFLYEMGQLTWEQVRGQVSGGHRRHHEQEIGSVCKKAQDLISSLRHAEIFDQLFRFRVGAKKRLWGYEREGVFYVLWWDTDHQVYPTEPS